MAAIIEVIAREILDSVVTPPLKLKSFLMTVPSAAPVFLPVLLPVSTKQ